MVLMTGAKMFNLGPKCRPKAGANKCDQINATKTLFKPIREKSIKAESEIPNDHLETLIGVVERITYHNPENGWTVLKVAALQGSERLVSVVVHQTQVFAGATMEFQGAFSHHPQHGSQFKAVMALEKKPATTAALEKYLGSGLIKGIGPAIARRIVAHFDDRTLEIFDKKIDELVFVPGISEKKLQKIRTSWEDHRAVRDVMIFLQGYGVSTLYATKIYKAYGNKAIEIVSKNPYRLAAEIYGIGFFSADKIALAMGLQKDGELRIEAGVRHVLSTSRDQGHCFLTEGQILLQTPELLRQTLDQEKILATLEKLINSQNIKMRKLNSIACYYDKKLYFDELTFAKNLQRIKSQVFSVNAKSLKKTIQDYCLKNLIQLSAEQESSIFGICQQAFSVLTGGPGCGKTTTTRVLVQVLRSLKKSVLLAAPTGRAAQRMTEVIGFEAKTIHRLLGWKPGPNGFAKNDKETLDCDFLIIDESSMLDITLGSALLKSVPTGAQVLFIGDPDQLPSVGAGDVLADLLKSKGIVSFRLTKVFRQAQASSIIRYAHQINVGEIPEIASPIQNPKAFLQGNDCLFVDADEATREQIQFIQKSKWAISQSGLESSPSTHPLTRSELQDSLLSIPQKFRHVDLNTLARSESSAAELKAVLKNIHPWSSLNFGLTALETLVRLATKSIPEWLGLGCEIQVLTPQVRGSLGTININLVLQNVCNPQAVHKSQIQLGNKILREGDRVIQTRNNYELGVFNGDIGLISEIDTDDQTCLVSFPGPEDRQVTFERDHLGDLSLAYAITIHKSQGSEFQAVIVPVLGQHFNMLYRNLIYTGLTRAKKLAIFVGSRRAFATAIGQIDNRQRQTALAQLLAD